MLNGLLSRHRVGGGGIPAAAAGAKQPPRPGNGAVAATPSETLSAYNLLKRTTPNVPQQQAPTSIGRLYHNNTRNNNNFSDIGTTNNVGSDYDDIHRLQALSPAAAAAMALASDYSCDNANPSTQSPNLNSSYTVYSPGNKLPTPGQTAPPAAAAAATSQHSKPSTPPNYIRLNKLKLQQQRSRKPIATKDCGQPQHVSHLEVTSGGSQLSANLMRLQNRSRSLGSSAMFLNKHQQSKPTPETTSHLLRSTRLPLAANTTMATTITKETESSMAKKLSVATKGNVQIDKSSQSSIGKPGLGEPKRALHQPRATANTPVVKSVHVVNQKGAKVSSTFYSPYASSSSQSRSLIETKRSPKFSPISSSSISTSGGGGIIKSASSTTSISSSKSITTTSIPQTVVATKKRVPIKTSSVKASSSSSMSVVDSKEMLTAKSMPVSLKKLTVIQASSDKHASQTQPDAGGESVSAKPNLPPPEDNNSSVANTKDTSTANPTAKAAHFKFNIKRTDTITLRSSPKAQPKKKVAFLKPPPPTKSTKVANRKQQINRFVSKCPPELIYLVNENVKLAFRLASFDQKLTCLEHIFLTQTKQNGEKEEEEANKEVEVVNVEVSNKIFESKTTTTTTTTTIPWLEIIKRARTWIEGVRTQNSMLQHPTVVKMMRAKSNDKTMLDEMMKLLSKPSMDADTKATPSKGIKASKSSNELSAEDELLVLLDRITQFSSNIVLQQQQQQQQQQSEKSTADNKLKAKTEDKIEEADTVNLKADWINSMPEDFKHVLESAFDGNEAAEYQFKQIYKLKPGIIKQIVALVKVNARLVELRNEFDALLCAHLKATGKAISKEEQKMFTHQHNSSEQHETEFRNLKLGSPPAERLSQSLAPVISNAASTRPARLRQQKCHPPPPPPPLTASTTMLSSTTHSAIVSDQEKMQTNFTSDGDSGGEYTGINSNTEFVAIGRAKISPPEMMMPQDELSSLLEKIASCSQTIAKHKGGGGSGSCASSNTGSGCSTTGSTSCPNASGHNGGVSSASSGCCCSSTSIMVDQHKLYQSEYGMDMMPGCCLAGSENPSKINYVPNGRSQLRKGTELSKDSYLGGQRMKPPADGAGGYSDIHHNFAPEFEYSPLDESAFITPGFMFSPAAPPLEHILSSPSLYGAYPPPPTAPPEIQVYNVHTSTPHHHSVAGVAAADQHYDTPRRREHLYAASAAGSLFTKPKQATNEASLPASAFIFDPSVDVNVFLSEIEKELEENMSICSYASAPPFDKFGPAEEAYADLSSTASSRHHQGCHNLQNRSYKMKSSVGVFNSAYGNENGSESLDEPVYASIQLKKSPNAAGATEHTSALSHYSSCCSAQQDETVGPMLPSANQTSVDGNWKLCSRFDDTGKDNETHQRHSQKTQHFPFPALNSMVNLIKPHARKAPLQPMSATPTMTSTVSNNSKLDKFRSHVANLAAQEADNHLESIEKWLYDNLHSALQQPPDVSDDDDDAGHQDHGDSMAKDHENQVEEKVCA